MNAYPLSWPAGWPRTDQHCRVHAKFHKTTRETPASWRQRRDLSIAEGVERVLAELTRLGLTRDDIIISTDVRVRLDGLPRSDAPAPKDPGAAVYWQERGGTSRVIAVDKYHRLADNLAAIAGTLEALRAIERWGGAQILERAFTGFTPLPAPGAARPWWEVLGCNENATAEAIKTAYRRAAMAAHPDRGGSDERMAELNRAYDEAQNRGR